MYAIYVDGRGWVIKHNGWNLFSADKDHATKFRSKEDAIAGRPGHHADMGGAGFIGRVVRI